MEQSFARQMSQYDDILVHKCRFLDPWGYHHFGPSHAGDIQLETPSQPEIVAHVRLCSRILVSLPPKCFSLAFCSQMSTVLS